jgi:hypothetical protein
MMLTYLNLSISAIATNKIYNIVSLVAVEPYCVCVAPKSNAFISNFIQTESTTFKK